MQIWRLKKVLEQTGLCRTSVYKAIKAGTFPRQVPLGGRAVGWLASEVEAWIRANVAKRDCDTSGEAPCMG